jgi:hypothetical protein
VRLKPRKLLARWAATVTEISCICTIFRSPSAEAGNMPALQETADIVRIAASPSSPFATLDSQVAECLTSPACFLNFGQIKVVL